MKRNQDGATTAEIPVQPNALTINLSEPLNYLLAGLSEAAFVYEHPDTDGTHQRRAQIHAITTMIGFITALPGWNEAGLASPLCTLLGTLLDIENGIQPPTLAVPPKPRTRDPMIAERQKLIGALIMELYIRVGLAPNRAAEKAARKMTVAGFRKYRGYAYSDTITTATIKNWRNRLSRNNGLAGNTGGPWAALYRNLAERVPAFQHSEADVDAWADEQLRRLPRL
jgi:hypothetical protein